MSGRIWLSPPDVGQLEREMLLAAFDSNWIAPVGPDIDAFEAEMASRIGVGHAVALSSGTAGLHLALVLAGVSAGNIVLVPSLTFVATANAVRYVGAEPVLVDSDPSNWCMDVNLVEDELRRRARNGTLPAAVVSVDLYGACPNYDALTAVCDEFGVPLIEDAAEALGSSYRSKPAGSFGQSSVFSFNGNKIITTSGGGMLVSSSEELVDRARHLATQAREPVAHYEHVDLGFNYRLSNLLAALGRAQLRGLDDRIARRRAIWERYHRALATQPGFSFPEHGDEVEPNHWLTCVLVDQTAFGASPADIRLTLDRADIEARATWKPLHLQPLYRDAQFVGTGVAQSVFDHGLCLPSGSKLSEPEQERIVDVVLSCRR